MVEFDSAIFLGIPLDDLVVKDENSKINMRLLNAKKEKTISNTYSTKSSIITLQPYQNSVEFGNSIATDESAYKIVDSYNYTFSQNLDNEHVTPDAFMSLSDYGIVILEGHGGNFKNIGYIISLPLETSVENYAKYITEIRNGWLHPNGAHFVLTEKFFKEYYSENDFNNTIIYLGTCHGGDDNVGIREILEQKGAEAVMTYKNSVIIKYMHELLPTIFNRLSKGDSVEEAVNKAKKKHGDHDPYIDGDTYNSLGFWDKVWYTLGLLESSNPAELILNGNNTSFKLSELKNCALTGTVTNRDSGAPIQNVTIEVKENNGDVHTPVITTVKTDDSGGYSMQLLYGNYILTLTHDDYKTISSTLTVNTECLVKDIALSWNGIVVPLPDKYTLTYTVFDETTEQPIPNVAVNVTEQGDSFDNVIESVTTDENGQITLALPEGDYVLSLSHDSYQSSVVPVTFNAESTNGSIYLKSTRIVTASGDCGASGNNVKWTLYSDGEMVIKGRGKMKDYDYASYVPWYSMRSSITKLTICNGVTSIGRYTFSNCTSLSKVAISDSVTLIEYYAFEYCSCLSSLDIPKSVTTINNAAFWYCSSLSGIIIPEGVSRIGNFTFGYCSALSNIVIPNSVTKICNSAFFQCVRLKSILIPESVTSIDDFAFYGCGNLSNIIMPENITHIGVKAFDDTGYYYNKSNWKNKLLYIGNYLIKADSTISGSQTIRPGTKLIAGYAFYKCTNLTNIILPEGFETICTYSAFQNCTNLKSVTIPKSTTTIGNAAFKDCNNLSDIYYSGSQENWNSIVFGQHNENLKNVTIHYNS